MPSAPRSGSATAACPPCTPPSCSATVQRAIVERTGIDPTEVGQVVGGCVSQVGEQAFNIARTAWLAAGLPLDASPPPRSTPSAARSQQATNLATALVGAGVVDVAVACGVEVDEPHPDRQRRQQGARPRRPDPEDLLRAVRDDLAVRGRRAHRRQVGHHPRRHRRVRLRVSQQRAAQAWAEDRFAGQYITVEAPDLDEEGKPTGTTHTVGARRGPARDHAREAGHAEAGRPRERRAHRRQLVADLRRRRRRADDDRGEGRRARPDARRPASSTPASSASTRC